MSEKNLVIGIHSVEALLKKHPERIITLYVLKDRQDNKIQAMLDLAKRYQIVIEYHPRAFLDRLSQQGNHQGVLAQCQKARAYSEQDLESILLGATKPLFFLILDGVQDPHNLGACLRTADAAGVDAVIAPKDRSVGLTPTVAKVASGAAEMVPFIQVTNLARTMRFMQEQNIWLFGAAAEADQSLYQADLTMSLAMVLGAEGAGLRRLTKEHCDKLLSIPMQGTVDSLNVSVAAGIFLFEAVRQRS